MQNGKYKGVEIENLSEDTRNILKEWGYINEIQERVESDNLQSGKAGRSVRSESEGSTASDASSARDKSETKSEID